ncbi:hypothetical protein Pelo_7095 [Pelomyxa schiedti]|nr:hypothetical protein Pelo_7095 [Pelomyxa schiedti]
MQIQPSYLELQHQTESLSAALAYLEENANDEERLLWKSWVVEKMTMVKDGVSAGCAEDDDPDRHLESVIRSSALKPQIVNRSEPCACNPYWLQWVEENYPDPNTGMPCSVYCETSKILALSRHIDAIADVNSKQLNYMTRMWGVSNIYCMEYVFSQIE